MSCSAIWSRILHLEPTWKRSHSLFGKINSYLKGIAPKLRCIMTFYFELTNYSSGCLNDLPIYNFFLLSHFFWTKISSDFRRLLDPSIKLYRIALLFSFYMDSTAGEIHL